MSIRPCSRSSTRRMSTNLEADLDDTRVRLRGRRDLIDLRPLDEVARAFAPHGFAVAGMIPIMKRFPMVLLPRRW